jgi:adenylate cyclase class IV
MTSKNIEVELRGPLNKKDYRNLLTILKSKGQLMKKQQRLLLDYSTFLEGIGERKLDVRVRITNRNVEIVVKKGKFGGTSREEASIFPEDNSIENTLKLMSLLGYNKAVACDRSIERYMVDDIEVAIQDVNCFSQPGTIHSRFFEAEIMVDEEGKDIAIEKIRDFLSIHNLKEFTETEWYDYVAKINKEANGVFDYENDSIETITRLIN